MMKFHILNVMAGNTVTKWIQELKLIFLSKIVQMQKWMETTMENHVKTILALNFKPDSPVVGLYFIQPNQLGWGLAM